MHLFVLIIVTFRQLTISVLTFSLVISAIISNAVLTIRPCHWCNLFIKVNNKLQSGDHKSIQ